MALHCSPSKKDYLKDENKEQDEEALKPRRSVLKLFDPFLDRIDPNESQDDDVLDRLDGIESEPRLTIPFNPRYDTTSDSRNNGSFTMIHTEDEDATRKIEPLDETVNCICDDDIDLITNNFDALNINKTQEGADLTSEENVEILITQMLFQPSDDWECKNLWDEPRFLEELRLEAEAFAIFRESLNETAQKGKKSTSEGSNLNSTFTKNEENDVKESEKDKIENDALVSTAEACDECEALQKSPSKTIETDPTSSINEGLPKAQPDTGSEANETMVLNDDSCHEISSQPANISMSPLEEGETLEESPINSVNNHEIKAIEESPKENAVVHQETIEIFQSPICSQEDNIQYLSEEILVSEKAAEAVKTANNTTIDNVEEFLHAQLETEGQITENLQLNAGSLEINIQPSSDDISANEDEPLKNTENKDVNANEEVSNVELEAESRAKATDLVPVSEDGTIKETSIDTSVNKAVNVGTASPTVESSIESQETACLQLNNTLKYTTDTQVSSDADQLPALEVVSNQEQILNYNRVINELREDNQRLETALKQKDETITKQRVQILKYEQVREKYEEQLTECGKKNISLKRSHDMISRSLATLETAFSDVIEKYEQAKIAIERFKKNESIYKGNIKILEQRIMSSYEDYQNLKKHATSLTEEANMKYKEITESSEAHRLKQDAVVKRLELKVASLQRTLETKCKEFDDLSALYDSVAGSM